MSQKVAKAYEFAKERHKDQVMLCGSPYFYHVLQVAGLVTYGEESWMNVLDVNILQQVALLHDVLEDTKTTYNELRAEFGPEVADHVMALTKNVAIAKVHRMQDSLDRIKWKGNYAVVVKLADRIVNLSSVPKQWSKEKIAEYKAESQHILNELGWRNVYLAGLLEEKLEEYP
jgi:guanosine-3',5'-bis(diphosphate) 3'-pyrophosphohydrolase